MSLGDDDDPHHGYLDIGSFVVYWRNEYYLSDLGGGHYDEQYFDQARWDYPQASSLGHNVVFVNGEKQIPGKLKDQPFNFEIGGKVTEFSTSAERDYVVMNPTNAYPKKELKEWRRHIILEKPMITVVLDEIKSDIGSVIEVRFHSGTGFKNMKDFVLLEGKAGTMALIRLAKRLQYQAGKRPYTVC